MYDTIVRWIGWQTCSFAGDLSEVLNAGPACLESQAWNIGVVAVALVAFTVTVMVINARRRHRRENYFRR